MNNGEAVSIFYRIDSDQYTDEQKGEAILKVLNMETHNTITKFQIIEVMRWLWNRIFVEYDEKSEKVEAYKIVYEDLLKCGLFRGSYDARNGKPEFMAGISTVMEAIAAGVSEECQKEFTETFLENLIVSKERLNGKMFKDKLPCAVD